MTRASAVVAATSRSVTSPSRAAYALTGADPPESGPRSASQAASAESAIRDNSNPWMTKKTNAMKSTKNSASTVSTEASRSWPNAMKQQ